MAYIGNQPTTVAFLTDQFSGTGSQTAFTLSAAPANTASILVAITGVLQDPSTYSVSGTTLTFSAAPPSGTGNISVRFLGIPASGVVTTAYRTQTEFTATSGQTTFTPPSYTPGFIDVYRNGVLLGSADYTATNGTTVVLAVGATTGDLIETVSFLVSSVLNAIPATAGSVNSTYIQDGGVTAAKLASNAAVLSLNGSTGALKGATLVNTTNFSAATTIDVTTGMSSAGWYMIQVTGTISTTASATEFLLRTSSDGGSTFNASASDYKNINQIDGSFLTTSYMSYLFSKNATSGVWQYQANILLYTGTASSYPTVSTFTGSISQATANAITFNFYGMRQANEQVNAIRFIRNAGTNTTTGTVYVYYLGI